MTKLQQNKPTSTQIATLTTKTPTPTTLQPAFLTPTFQTKTLSNLSNNGSIEFAKECALKKQSERKHEIKLARIKSPQLIYPLSPSYHSDGFD